MLKKLKYLFIIPIIFMLTGCGSLFNTDQKPNPNYDNTKYFNDGWNINIPKSAKATYFCYSTWTSIFSFGGDNYVVYTLEEPLDIKWNDNKSEEFEEYFSNSINSLLTDYEDKASYGTKEMPDFTKEYMWTTLGENDDVNSPSPEFKYPNGNSISCLYFSDINKLFVFSVATHAVIK